MGNKCVTFISQSSELNTESHLGTLESNRDYNKEIILSEVRTSRREYQLPNGMVLHCNEIGGSLNGACQISADDGTCIVASYKANQLDGHIEMHRNDKIWFKGETDKGILTGEVYDLNEMGDLFEGNYENGRRNGKGKIRFANGDLYEGEFLNNFMHGKGYYKWSNGGEHKGNYKFNKANGFGELEFPDLSHFSGEFHNGLMEGTGKMIFPDGSIYEGFWSKGLRDGEGRIANKGGNFKVGIWKEGKFMKWLN